MGCMSNNWVWVSNRMSFLGGGDHEERNETDVALSFGFNSVGDAVEYEYDFGDSWRAKVTLEQIDAKQVRTSEYTPGIIVVGGRGKTVPEYGGGGGNAYNKKKLNEELSQMDEFVHYPANVVVDEEVDDDDKEDQDEGEDDEEHEEEEDEDLQRNHNQNQERKSKKSSVLGKRRRQGNDSNVNYKKMKADLLAII